ncbi:DVU3141 family protein [Halomonas halocynthiae]|uniref:DVU3141 family protein n=1 Tax=Halomonas halocynthiae TaxID=176290 RepID=UPI000428F2C1|nr:DVU3141 family protein [Halomonas halocynthiae]
MLKVLVNSPSSAIMRLLALVLVTALSGCAQMNTQHNNASGSVIAGDDQGTPVGVSLSSFLNESNRGEAVQLAKSPWGPGVNVYPGQPYFAASGRVCRELTIQGNGGERAAIACKMVDGQWATRRQVTSAQPQGSRF